MYPLRIVIRNRLMKSIQKLTIFLLLAFFILPLISCNQTNSNDVTKGKNFAERIIFTSDREKSGQYYSMKPDGSDVTKINFTIPGNLKVNSLTWSQTSQQWAFSGENNGLADIYIASKDGSSVKNITNTASLYEDDPKYSPDGMKIAYTVSDGSQNTYIMTNNIEGTNPKRVTQLQMLEDSPIWLSNNQHILMYSSKEGSPNIFKASTDKYEMVNMSKGKGLDDELSLADNFSRFVFVSDRAKGRDLFVYDLGTNEITQMTAGAGSVSSPRISPDGSKVVFRLVKDAAIDLFIVNVSDKSLTKITNSPKLTKTNIVWSLDGQSVLYTAEKNGQLDIFSISIADKVEHNLTDNPSNDNNPFWIRIAQ
jgi:Tol biopolymer transport system component